MDEKNVEVKENEYSVEPGQSFEVDLFRPADAKGVARLFQAVYGDGYPIKTFPALFGESKKAPGTGAGRLGKC